MNLNNKKFRESERFLHSAILRLPIFLRSSINKYITDFVETVSATEVFGLVFWQARMVDAKLSERILLCLSAANGLGWVSYSIFDQVFEHGKNLKSLPAAIALNRLSFEMFLEKEKEMSKVSSRKFRNFTAKFYNQIDEALISEHTMKTGNRKPKRRFLEKLLWQKSIGHALGPVLISEYFGNSKQTKLTLELYKNYLSARQLNDDGLDWKEDRKSKHITLPLLELGSKSNSYYKSICLPKIRVQINNYLGKASQKLQFLGYSAEIQALLDRIKA